MDLSPEYLFHQDDVRNTIAKYLPLDTVLNLHIASGKNIWYYIKDGDYMLNNAWNVNLMEYPLVKFVEEFGSMAMARLISGSGDLSHFEFFDDLNRKMDYRMEHDLKGFGLGDCDNWIKKVEVYPLVRKYIGGPGRYGYVFPEEGTTLEEIKSQKNVAAYLLEDYTVYIIRDLVDRWVDFLVGHGFDFDYSDGLLCDAINNDRFYLAHLLLDLGADPDCVYSDHSALTLAIQKNQLDLADKLIDYGANMNYIAIMSNNFQLISPLIEAINIGNIDMVQMLINKGISLKPQIVRGQVVSFTHNPMTYIETEGTPEIRDLLQNYFSWIS